MSRKKKVTDTTPLLSVSNTEAASSDGKRPTLSHTQTQYTLYADDGEQQAFPMLTGSGLTNTSSTAAIASLLRPESISITNPRFGSGTGGDGGGLDAPSSSMCVTGSSGTFGTAGAMGESSNPGSSSTTSSGGAMQRERSASSLLASSGPQTATAQIAATRVPTIPRAPTLMKGGAGGSSKMYGATSSSSGGAINGGSSLSGGGGGIGGGGGSGLGILTEDVKDTKTPMSGSGRLPQTFRFSPLQSRSDLNVGVTGTEEAIATAAVESKSRQDRRNLLSAPDYWPGVKRLHWLFRIFDINHSGRLSYVEFKLGLKDLGFDVSNDNAIKQMLVESLPDFTGTVSESDFIKLFRQLNRQSLAIRLAKDAAEDPTLEYNRTKIMILDCGRYKNKLCFSRADITPAQLSGKLDELKKTHAGWQDPFRWIDFCGHSPSALNVLANDYNLPAKLLHGIEFSSKPKCVVCSESHHHHHSSGGSASTIGGAHHSDSKSGSGSHGGGHSGSHGSGLSTPAASKVTPSYLHLCLPLLIVESFPTLINPTTGLTELKTPEADYYQRRPRIQRHEVHLVVIDRHTILTVRKPQNVNEPPPPELQKMWDEVIHDLQAKFTSGSAGLLSFTTASSFLLELLDDLGDDNWLIADAIRDWQETVAKGVESPYERANVVPVEPEEKYELHLLDMTRLISQAHSELKVAMEVMTQLLAEAPSVSQQTSGGTMSVSTPTASGGGAPVVMTGHPSFSVPATPRGFTVDLTAPTPMHSAQLSSQPRESTLLHASSASNLLPPTIEGPPPASPPRPSRTFTGPPLSGTSGGELSPAIPITPPAAPRPSVTTLAAEHKQQFALQAAAAAASIHAHAFPKILPRSFIMDHIDDYAEVAESYGRLVANVGPLDERCAALTKFYNSKKNNAAKETLYLLTILMAALAPIQIGTGVYGMNFSNMPELQTSNGYFVFLICAGLWLLFCFGWFARKKKWI